jgi:HNH endonuclease
MANVVELRNIKGEVVATTCVSPDDFERVMKLTWYRNGQGYASGPKGILMHHFLIGKPKPGMVVDHKNKNKLDNTRENIHFVSMSQNAQNIPKQKNTSSTYIGVCWNKRLKSWKVTVQNKHYGYFEDEVEAAKTYDRWAIKLFGEHAATNNLLSPSDLEHVLQNNIQYESKKPGSRYGVGISLTGKKFRVNMSENGKEMYIGTYDTLEEAQKVSGQCRQEKEQRRSDAIKCLPVLRNDDGNPIIALTGRKGIVDYTIVDENVWHTLMHVRWNKKNGYAAGVVHGKSVRMHRYIYELVHGEIPESLVIDHWGKDELDPQKKKLDNRISNLRAVTLDVNSQNIIRTKSKNKYAGITQKGNGWEVRIRSKYIGYCLSEMDAVNAYNKEARELYGEHAKLNVFAS